MNILQMKRMVLGIDNQKEYLRYFWDYFFWEEDDDEQLKEITNKAFAKIIDCYSQPHRS